MYILSKDFFDSMTQVKTTQHTEAWNTQRRYKYYDKILLVLASVFQVPLLANFNESFCVWHIDVFF